MRIGSSIARRTDLDADLLLRIPELATLEHALCANEREGHDRVSFVGGLRVRQGGEQSGRVTLY